MGSEMCIRDRARTTRGKTARGRCPRRNCQPIKTNHRYQTLSEHHSSTAVLISDSRTVYSAPYADRFARTSKSAGAPPSPSAGSARRRPISRSRRFTRLRSTTLRPYLGTMSPSRDCKPGAGPKKISTCSFFSLFPCLSNSRISDPRWIRVSRGNFSALPGSAFVEPTCCQS